MIGIAHVGGKYEIDHAQGGFLLNGADEIKTIGSAEIKIFLSPDYATQYPETWAGGITSLTTLAQATQMASLFVDVGFNRYFLNCFTWNATAADLWKFGTSPSFLQAEYDEMKALAEHLLTTYAGTGKQFILQSWESDWAYLGATDKTIRDVPPKRAQYMKAWMRARQQAVEDARRSIGQSNVSVLHAMEVNRVQDCYGDSSIARVCNDVLPFITVDMVSYSCYDSIYDLSVGGTTWGADAAGQIADIATRFSRAREVIGRAAPNSPIYLGEWGVAENELPALYDVGDIIDAVEAEGFLHSVYWQVWDNEIISGGDDPPNGNEDLRGFWCEKFDGTQSLAGAKISALLA